MIGRHIVDGDIAIIDRARTPKRWRRGCRTHRSGKHAEDAGASKMDAPYLRAENPHLSRTSIPSHELLIQGVMVALVRKHV